MSCSVLGKLQFWAIYGWMGSDSPGGAEAGSHCIGLGNVNSGIAQIRLSLQEPSLQERRRGRAFTQFSPLCWSLSLRCCRRN